MTLGFSDGRVMQGKTKDRKQFSEVDPLEPRTLAHLSRSRITSFSFLRFII